MRYSLIVNHTNGETIMYLVRFSFNLMSDYKFFKTLDEARNHYREVRADRRSQGFFEDSVEIVLVNCMDTFNHHCDWGYDSIHYCSFDGEVEGREDLLIYEGPMT